MEKTGGSAQLDAHIQRRVRACDYLVVAQLFLQDNFLLTRPLTSDDIKPRLLGHWGTCHGINIAYANLRQYFSKTILPTHPASAAAAASSRPAPTADPFSLDFSKEHDANSTEKQPETTVPDPNFSFILGPGHGFPALQANLFLDGELAKVDPKATRDLAGLAYVCKQFSWPGGFPSHSSPLTPSVICEGGELGYALGAAYGYVLGQPQRTVAVMLGDGELETAAALASLNLVKLVGDHDCHGRVLPILHLNGYKISGPTVYGRKSVRELHELIRGFGYTPLNIDGDNPAAFQSVLQKIPKIRASLLYFAH